MVVIASPPGSRASVPCIVFSAIMLAMLRGSVLLSVPPREKLRWLGTKRARS